MLLGKEQCFILSVRSNFNMTDSLSVAVHAFASRVLMSVSVGSWTCLLASENYHLVWRCHLIVWSTCIPSCLRWHGGLFQQLLVPDYVAGFRLGQEYLPEALCYRLENWKKIKSRNIKMTVITVIFRTLGTFPKDMRKGLG